MTDGSGLAQFALIAFSSVFIIVDPLATAPLFVTMTAADPREKQRHMARRASVMVFVTLTLFALLGDAILRLFAITLGAFRMAGGVILFGIGMNMLRIRTVREVQTPEEIVEGVEKDDIALMPLAFPMLSGPGAIATVMALSQQAPSVGHLIVLVVVISITCLLTYGVLRHAVRITTFLGQTGLHLLTRMMGLLLAVIAVQFVLNGLQDALAQVCGRG